MQKREEEIQNIKKEGDKYKKDNITIINKKDKNNKLIFQIPKKYIKSSVQRNYIKRFVRELVKKNKKTGKMLFMYRNKKIEKNLIEDLINKIK